MDFLNTSGYGNNYGGPGMGMASGGMTNGTGMSGGDMMGSFEAMMMVMSSMMTRMSSGMMGQVLGASPSGGMISAGQSPKFGGGGRGCCSSSLGNAAQSFLGGKTSGPRKAKPQGKGKGTPGGADGSSATGGAKAGKPTGKFVSRPGGKIDASIAKNFDKMVAAAKKDGVSLQISSGLRTRAEQEKLYAAYKNGTGNLAAKPGTSNHESGLAIDFKNTPGAYSWLAKNAEKYGLKNLPSEPWHYSTNGR